jgi:hypothetical protein
MGLEGASLYEVNVWEEGGFYKEDRDLNCGERGGDELMQAGLLLDCMGHHCSRQGDFFAELFLLRKK